MYSASVAMDSIWANIAYSRNLYLYETLRTEEKRVRVPKIMSPVLLVEVLGLNGSDATKLNT